MNKLPARLVVLLGLTLLATLKLTVPTEAQATVTFVSPSVTIDQGTSPGIADFFGQIDNSAGTTAFVPATINVNVISGSVDISPLVTTYGTFGSPDNLPASVAAGAVSSPFELFSVDTTSLPLGTYSGSVTVSDASNSNFTAPANFSITVTPEPSVAAALAIGASGLGLLTLRARRKPKA